MMELVLCSVVINTHLTKWRKKPFQLFRFGTVQAEQNVD